MRIAVLLAVVAMVIIHPPGTDRQTSCKSLLQVFSAPLFHSADVHVVNDSSLATAGGVCPARYSHIHLAARPNWVASFLQAAERAINAALGPLLVFSSRDVRPLPIFDPGRADESPQRPAPHVGHLSAARAHIRSFEVAGLRCSDAVLEVDLASIQYDFHFSSQHLHRGWTDDDAESEDLHEHLPGDLDLLPWESWTDETSSLSDKSAEQPLLEQAAWVPADGMETHIQLPGMRQVEEQHREVKTPEEAVQVHTSAASAGHPMMPISSFVLLLVAAALVAVQQTEVLRLRESLSATVICRAKERRTSFLILAKERRRNEAAAGANFSLEQSCKLLSSKLNKVRAEGNLPNFGIESVNLLCISG